MAIKTLERKKDNTLGMLGTIASMAGAAFGMPWLGALGTGMQGANAMMNGDSRMETANATSGAMNEILDKLKNAWKNPAEGNIAKTEQQNAVEKAQKILGQGYSTSWDYYKPNWNWEW